MKKSLSAIGALVFIVLVGFFMFKNRPTGHGPVKIMNPTYFENETKIGRVISRRYYADLKNAKLIVIGSSPFLKSQSLIWKEFIKASLVDGIVFDDVVSIEGLPELTNKDRFFKELPKLEPGPGRTLVHVPSNEDWKKKVEQAYPSADYVFFQAPFSMREERRKALGLDCKSNEDQSFSCLAYRAGTRYYRKKRTDNKLTAMMEQLGRNFYILFIGEKY